MVRIQPPLHCPLLLSHPLLSSLSVVFLHLNKGYIKMFEIPVGARHLLIQETDASSHHLGESGDPPGPASLALTLQARAGQRSRRGVWPEPSEPRLSGEATATHPLSFCLAPAGLITQWGSQALRSGLPWQWFLWATPLHTALCQAGRSWAASPSHQPGQQSHLARLRPPVLRYFTLC